ncbi:MAG: hypothetical protein ACRDWV_03830 [Acidimicrobiales bacterium]
MTLAEFVSWEESQALRHELVGGRIYAKSGGTRRHSVTKDAITRLAAPAVLAAGCIPFGSDRKLVTPWGTRTTRIS